MRVLLAGAGGAIGAHVVAALRAAGHTVRGLSRRRLLPDCDETVVADALRPGELAGLADGVDVVVSALGASVAPSLAGRRTDGQVDVPANLHLLDETRRAGVARFVYVGVRSAPGYAHTRYVQAHEQVSDALASSRRVPGASASSLPAGLHFGPWS